MFIFCFNNAFKDFKRYTEKLLLLRRVRCQYNRYRFTDEMSHSVYLLGEIQIKKRKKINLNLRVKCASSGGGRMI